MLSLRYVDCGIRSERQRSCWSWLLVCLLFSALPCAGQRPQAWTPDVVLNGAVTDANAQTYLELPFRVSAGVSRITVDFSYTDRDKHTSIDLGLFDPQRFRGWSGGNKSTFTVSETDATPSYLPGSIPSGTWNLILGIPNIERGVHSTYEAKIYFSHPGEPPAVSTFSSAPLRSGPAWYRGDLHMHTAHSDGSCLSQSGVSVPCPLYRTVETAASRHLDFIAISDHNTISQYDAMRELQPFFDRMLLIPAREITTFYGHANVFGTTEFIDFRVGSRSIPNSNALLAEVARAHAILSINHPGAPSNASCMGCGWTAPGTDYSKVTAIEAINNGGQPEGPYSNIPFWQDKLNKGFRLTGVGGSDNHEPDYPLAIPSAIGHPTTVVYAENLSENAILDGIKAGHVFIDVEGATDRTLEFSARSGAQTAIMGDILKVPAGETVQFNIRMVDLTGAHPEIVHDTPEQLLTNEAMNGFAYKSDGKRHWFRVNVRSADGRLLIVGNPIYLNF
jgi:hypothetical protein